MLIIILSGVLLFVRDTQRLTVTLQLTNAFGNVRPPLTSMLIHSLKNAFLCVCWATMLKISLGAAFRNVYGM